MGSLGECVGTAPAVLYVGIWQSLTLAHPKAALVGAMFNIFVLLCETYACKQKHFAFLS